MTYRLAGQLLDGGDPVAGQPVVVIDTLDSNPANWSIVATAESASDGAWSVTVPGGDPERYHAVSQFDDGSTLKNALSKPYLTGQPFVGAGVVDLQFDVLSPTISAGSAIPDSVLHQYDAINDWSVDADPLPDSVGSADMALTGDPQNGTIGGESGIEGDGTDDHGTASVANLATNQTFGIAYTFVLPSISSRQAFAGVSDSGDGANRLAIFSGLNSSPGAIDFYVSDSSGTISSDGTIEKYTDSSFDDGSTHAAIINKSGNTAADVDIYVDDTSTTASTTTANDTGFDHTNFSQSLDLGFFGRNNGGSITDYMPLTFGVFEFNSEPYNQSDRDKFVSRRPEV